ncbi:MAG: inositol monophosphatase [Chloroflexota bacterium]|nr:MAG: inositol monophosphatase [Chloroflexota bacterium]
MDSTLRFAEELASETGKRLLELFNPQGTQTNLKSDQSVVTEADLAADRFIAESILKEFPDDVLISEELQPTIHAVNKPIWVVDPLDGTTNYSLGLPIWGVSIARTIKGWPEIGVVYFPILAEMFTAQRGTGAYLNGEPLHSRLPFPGNTTSFFSCCTRTHQRYDIRIRYKTRILGSACYTMCAVARGMAILGFETTPKIWDIAASWLILTESGAAVETFDRSKPFPLQAEMDYSGLNFPILAGATEEIISDARRGITAKP